MRRASLFIVSLAACGLGVARAPACAQANDVAAVYPSGPTVPERLLRISIRFRQPASPSVRSSVSLASGDRSISDALLSDALWSPDGTLLTLLFDPGRAKTGLLAHDSAGFALAVNDTLRLSVAGHVVKRWRVTGGGCAPLDVASWTTNAPAAGTRAALVVNLTTMLDVHAERLIAVADDAGARVHGIGRLDAGERVWRFMPERLWHGGPYALRVHARAETVCGDEAGDPFEHASETGRVGRMEESRRAFWVKMRERS